VHCSCLTSPSHLPCLPLPRRRAKRLKRLLKLIGGDIMTASLQGFSLRSWALLALLVVAHTVCFVVLVQQVDSQRRWGPLACAALLYTLAAWMDLDLAPGMLQAEGLPACADLGRPCR
jgi:hypothetical protein